jgi:hypothetical protein
MDRDIRVLRLTAMAAAILMPVTSFAQAPPPSQTPVSPKSELKSEQINPDACANSDTRTTVGQGGDLQAQNPSGSNLSDKLARSGGVICPPEQVDPAIKQPTPPGGAMPVLPPPGSPGGDPSVQPK